MSLLYWRGGGKKDMVPQMWPYQQWEKSHLPCHVHDTSPNAAQKSTGLLCSKDSLPSHSQLSHVQLGSFLQSCFPEVPEDQNELLHRYIPSKVQDFALPCVELQDIPFYAACDSLFQQQHSPLVYQPTPSSIISKLAEGALCPHHPGHY